MYVCLYVPDFRGDYVGRHAPGPQAQTIQIANLTRDVSHCWEFRPQGLGDTMRAFIHPPALVDVATTAGFSSPVLNAPRRYPKISPHGSPD